MKYIYYPSFDVLNHYWLKYALLYIDEIRPIIPHDAISHINDTTKKLLNESDFINPYNPRYEISLQASTTVLECLERIFKYPEDYTPLLGKDFIERWKLKENQNTILFEEKYTDSFKTFCNKNKIATENENGITISSEISNLYMNLFANCASEFEGLDVITDSSISNALNLIVHKQDNNAKDKIIQRTIRILTPNVHKTDLDNIIKLRNNSDFKQSRITFNQMIDSYLSKEIEEQDFIKYIESYQHEISTLINIVGITVTILLTFWNFILAPQAASPLNGVASGLSGVRLGTTLPDSVKKVRNNIKDLKKVRLVRKFFSSIKSL